MSILLCSLNELKCNYYSSVQAQYVWYSCSSIIEWQRLYDTAVILYDIAVTLTDVVLKMHDTAVGLYVVVLRLYETVVGWNDVVLSLYDTVVV